MDVTTRNFKSVIDELDYLIPRSFMVSIDGEFSGLESSKECRGSEYDLIQHRYLKMTESVKNFEMFQFGMCLWFKVPSSFMAQRNLNFDKEENKQAIEINGRDHSIEPQKDGNSIDEGNKEDKGNDEIGKNAGGSNKSESESNSKEKETSSFLLNGQEVPFPSEIKSDEEYQIFARPYNFYLFKETNGNFMCQASSMKFLAMHEMDFNTVFKYGITYMNRTEEENKKIELTSSYNSMMTERSKTIDMKKVNQTSSKFIQKIIDQVREWFKHSSSDKLNLPSCNSYLRKLIYQEVGSEFMGKVFMKLQVSEKGEQFIEITRILEEDVQQFIKNKVEEELLSFIGFRRIVKMILENENLFFVGHNMGLDIAHFFQKFIEDIPESLEEFRQKLHKSLPILIDTKYIINSYSFFKTLFGESSPLEYCYQKVTQNEDFEKMPAVELDPYLRQQVMNGNFNAHQAGYDAYMTGYLFIRLSQYVGKLRDRLYKGDIVSLEHLQEFTNVIFMHRLDVHLNLTGELPLQDRSNVLLLTNISKEVQNGDLYQKFARFQTKIRVSWVSENYCFVLVEDKSKIGKIIEELQGDLTLPYCVYTFQQAKDDMVLDMMIARKAQMGTTRKKRITREESKIDDNEKQQESAPPPKRQKNESSRNCLVM